MIIIISERLQQKLVSGTYVPSRSFLPLCEIKKYADGKNSYEKKRTKKILHSTLIK